MLLDCELPALYPPELLSEPADPLLGGERHWWVLYTKSRQEKALARDLHAKKIPFFLPLVKQTKLCRKRRVTTEVPVFAGYVFLFGTREDRVEGLTTNRVSRTLPRGDEFQLHSDLRQLQRLIESGAPLTVEQRLSPGNSVRVKSGSFAGMEGTIISRRGTNRLLIRINFLQQGVSVCIDDFVLEWIG